MNKDEIRGRFKDAPFANVNWPVMVIGAGGIGSWTAFQLARLGIPDLFVFDHDMVEIHNVGGQFFKPADVGKSKVEALANALLDYSYERVHTVRERYNENSPTGPVMISAVDNMASRKIIFERWRSQEDRILFIDGRLDLEDVHVYCVCTPEQEEAYADTLVSDDELPDLSCTMKQTTHVAMLIASLITQSLVNHWCNVQAELDIRRLPYHLSYHGVPLLMDVDQVPEHVNSLPG